MTRSRTAIIILLALAALAPALAAADSKSQAKRDRAIDKLAFAVEEMDIVARAARESELGEARKQYKHASKYFLDAMKTIRGADPSESEREKTEVFEDRFRKLDDKVGDLDAETVGEIADLFHEAHEYFDPEAGG